ncbi:MAG TPA: adenylate/guanylate cyclase domain-containing protein [Syntrophales bacterium]|nr:adenylate/guanylate cyclase domain-containing protein [Syntrophales bacterium]HOX95601.1 adenylate/guanylate cyclase domain-containing protein [Syntrophales bacterium]HPI57135.1 adenylate/guanylate cyclase domain-containing protein [Syntrophales bacterium]HPN24778.1 adenylate/guanylate cyclase domain-containing protein [Syntrophales bacterium]HQM30065.1 adenylate/guanylate cyclase domain-containing protein [Syntrophales bacterium]
MENPANLPNEKPLRVPFRIALSAIFAVLLIAAIGTLGFLSYSNLRKNADDLSSQVIDETSSRIELWVKNLLSKANDQNQLNRATLGAIKVGPETFFRLSNYWRRVMETQPYFTFISVRLENGGQLSIERLADGKLSIRESQFDSVKRTLEIYDFWPEDYRQRRPYNHKKITFAPRSAPSGATENWYAKAVKAGQPVWIEARTIRKGAETVAGVSYAAPFYGPEKELRGVTSVDFDIVAISKFLAANPVGEEGFAFIIEKPAKGEPRVIAHPTPEILTHTVANERGLTQHEFVPYRNLKDVRVAGFMEQLSRNELLQPTDQIRILSFTAGGTEYFGSYRRMSGNDMPDWIIASIIPRKEIMGFADRNNLETLGIGLAGFLLILLASAWISGRISRPLKKISNESEAIGRFELEGGPMGHSIIKEVDRLMTATDDMKRGLRSFGKYVPTDVVRDIMASGGEAVLGGRKANLTIFFSDIEGFTSISEQLEPEALVDHLAEYLGEMNQQVRDEQGTVDKFIGDSIMAFWGAPMPNAEHALAACRAALRCQERLAALREKWQREGKPLFYQRIGINTGEVIVGNMGSENRMNYTVVGDHVNAASRFEGLNKFYGTNIIIGESTYDLVKDHFVARPIDMVSVMGKKTGLKVYELMGDKKTVEDRKVTIARITAQALEAYLARRFDEAIKAYETVRDLNPGDRPVGFMLVRCRQYLENPPPDNWDGVFRLESK